MQCARLLSLAGGAPSYVKERGSAGAEALRPNFFGQPCHGGAMLRMDARARHLQCRGCCHIVSEPYGPTRASSPGFASFRDRGRLRLRGKSASAAARRAAVQAVMAEPCFAWTPALHGLDRLARDLRRAGLAAVARTGARQPHLGTAPCPASDAQACRVPRVGRDAGSVGEVRRAGINLWRRRRTSAMGGQYQKGRRRNGSAGDPQYFYDLADGRKRQTRILRRGSLSAAAHFALTKRSESELPCG